MIKSQMLSFTGRDSSREAIKLSLVLLIPSLFPGSIIVLDYLYSFSLLLSLDYLNAKYGKIIKINVIFPYPQIEDALQILDTS